MYTRTTPPVTGPLACVVAHALVPVEDDEMQPAVRLRGDEEVALLPGADSPAKTPVGGEPGGDTEVEQEHGADEKGKEMVTASESQPQFRGAVAEGGEQDTAAHSPGVVVETGGAGGPCGSEAGTQRDAARKDASGDAVVAPSLPPAPAAAVVASGGSAKLHDLAGGPSPVVARQDCNKDPVRADDIALDVNALSHGHAVPGLAEHTQQQILPISVAKNTPRGRDVMMMSPDSSSGTPWLADTQYSRRSPFSMGGVELSFRDNGRDNGSPMALVDTPQQPSLASNVVGSIGSNIGTRPCALAPRAFPVLGLRRLRVRHLCWQGH